MTSDLHPGDLRMIPLDAIDVLNPRERKKEVFEDIVQNIKSIGLKKPITVTPRPGPDGSERFLLVCGEGRMKAFRALEQTMIPALVVSVNDESAFIMSLAENIARRQYRPIELLMGIERLRDQGYDTKTIAQKTGLTQGYIKDILTLLSKGEERLLDAVARSRIPLTIALTIMGAGDDDKAIQATLHDAYESGELRGPQLLMARRVIQKRKTFGRSMARGTPRKLSDVTASSLVRTYRKEVERQRQMVRKASFAQQRLVFVIGALQQLFNDEGFTTLLRAEGLDTLPTYLADRIWVGRRAA